MQPRAIDYGVAAESYWELTLEEIMLTSESAKRIRIADLKEKVMFEYKMAQLNAYAFNEPKKMPKPNDHYPFLKEIQNNEAKEVAPNNQPSIPQKTNWELHKEMMMRQAQAIKTKRARESRSEGGGGG